MPGRRRGNPAASYLSDLIQAGGKGCQSHDQGARRVLQRQWVATFVEVIPPNAPLRNHIRLFFGTWVRRIVRSVVENDS